MVAVVIVSLGCSTRPTRFTRLTRLARLTRLVWLACLTRRYPAHTVEMVDFLDAADTADAVYTVAAADADVAADTVATVGTTPPPFVVGGSAAPRSRSHPPPKSTPLGFRVHLPPSLPPSHGWKFHAGGCLRRASTICQSTPPSPPLRKGGDPCGRPFYSGSGLGFALPRAHNSQICSAAHILASGRSGLGFTLPRH